jgi:membrane fusion protein, multidrug efflux system
MHQNLCRRACVLAKIIWRELITVVLLCVASFASAKEPAIASKKLETVVVQQSRAAHLLDFDGVVEAVRQTVLAAQVPGAVTAISVKAGDRVKAGQLLVRIDAQSATQTVAASDAQVPAARAALDLAMKDFERQKKLYQTGYVSQAAMQQSEAQLKSAQAQLTALVAQASATRTQSGFFQVQAPYNAIVSELSVALGDMAMPGRPLLTLYDPSALRVTVAIPQSVVLNPESDKEIKVQLPGLGATREWITASGFQSLPTSDVSTHTAQLRLDLPPSSAGIRPGMFARVWLPVLAEKSTRIEVPTRAIVRRAEMTGLYIVGADGRPLLRLVRLGRIVGDNIEILSGVSTGERVAIDPHAAALVR